MNRAAIDVRRLILIAAALLSVLAALLVIVDMEPAVGAANARLAGDRDAVRSDDIAFASLPQLVADRKKLLSRYAPAPGNPGARFLRALAVIARRRGVHVVGTSFRQETGPGAPGALPGAPSDPDERFFTSERLTVTLRGPYRSTLLAIADLTMGPQIVRVDAPNLTRDAAGVMATIPVAILEPMGEGS